MIEVRLIKVTIRQTGIADGDPPPKGRNAAWRTDAWVAGKDPAACRPGTDGALSWICLNTPSNGVMMFVMTPFFIQQNGGTGFRHVRESLCRIWLTGLWPETKGELP